MGSQVALELPEIVEAIVRHIPITLKECQESLAAGDIHAYLTSRATLRSVALVSRVFAGPAMDALWAVLKDAGPLIRLLKTYEQSDISRDRVLRCVRQVQWISIDDRHIRNQGDLVESLTHLVPDGFLLPNIQGLQWAIFPRPIHDVLHRLIPPSLSAIIINWSMDWSLEDPQTHSAETQHPIVHFITGQATKLAHLELKVVDYVHDAEIAVPEFLVEKLNATDLTSLTLHPGPPSMTSPMMRRILELPLLQRLDVRQFGVAIHISVWSLKLRSMTSGMRDLDSCVLEHSYAELPHTLHQLFNDLDIIRSTRCLTLTAAHTTNRVSLEKWRTCWRDCGTSINNAGVSSTTEELYITDDAASIGDHGASFMDIFELFRQCINIKAVEHSSYYAHLYDESPTFILASEVRRIASIWPGLTHFGSDTILRNDLSHEADSQMTVADLPQIIRGLPATLESIRITLPLPNDWNMVVVSGENRNLNIRTVNLRCNAIDIAKTPETIKFDRPKDVRAIEILNENTIERVVGLLLDCFPSMTSVQIDFYPPSVTEKVLSVIKQLRTYSHQPHVDPPTSAGSRKVSVGDVLLIKDAATSASTCLVLEPAEFFDAPVETQSYPNPMYVRFFPESTRAVLPSGAVWSVVNDVTVRKHVIEWSKNMVKWDRLLVLLNWKKVVHDVLIASQKATVDEQELRRAEEIFDAMQNIVNRPTSDELETSRLGRVLAHAAAFGTRRHAKKHLKLRAQEQLAMWSDLLDTSPAAVAGKDTS